MTFLEWLQDDLDEETLQAIKDGDESLFDQYPYYADGIEMYDKFEDEITDVVSLKDVTDIFSDLTDIDFVKYHWALLAGQTIIENNWSPD